MPNPLKLNRKVSLRILLILMIAGALAPVALFGTLTVSRLIDSERRTSADLIGRAADELASAFDQEVSASVRALQVLGASTSLGSGDLNRFYLTMQRSVRSQPTWATIVLHDRNLKWLLNAREPLNASLGHPPEPKSIQEVINTGKPQVSRLVQIPPVAGSPAAYGFAVRVPLFGDDGKVQYVLSAVITTDVLAQILNRHREVPGEWVRTLVDQDGYIAARSKDQAQFVGKRASAKTLERFKRRETELAQTTTLDNVKVYSAYREGPLSGWRAVISADVVAFEMKTKRAETSMFLIAIAVIAFSFLVVLYSTASVRRMLKSGAESAVALSRGEVPKMEPSRVEEIEELRQALISSSQLLQSRDRAKSDFLANMSHELRTPLGIVVGMTETLKRNDLDPAERERSWEIIQRNATQLLRLIDDILDVSKLEADRLTIEKIPFSLHDLISSIAEEFQSQARGKGVVIRTILEPNAPNIVESDPVRVRQMIVNIVGNAIKFTHEGSIEVSLRASNDDLVRITVTDTGIGLTDEQQKQIFNFFSQADSSHTRKYGGTGLGLVLSRKLARAFNGDVVLARSQSGGGSTFEITFRAQAKSGVSKEMKRSPGETKVRERFDGERVLLAEDSADNVALLRSYLKNSGIDLTVVQNGREAHQAALSNSFDLILMDIQMPEVDGYEAAKLIRQSNTEVPIVALTAHALSDHRERAASEGFNGYLTKPISKAQLVEAIDKYARKSSVVGQVSI